MKPTPSKAEFLFWDPYLFCLKIEEYEGRGTAENKQVPIETIYVPIFCLQTFSWVLKGRLKELLIQEVKEPRDKEKAVKKQ